MAKKPPIPALSVLSFHDDSPPLQPSTERRPDVPPLDLDERPGGITAVDHYPTMDDPPAGGADGSATPRPEAGTPPPRWRRSNNGFHTPPSQGSPSTSRVASPRIELPNTAFHTHILQATQSKEVDGDLVSKVPAKFSEELEAGEFPRHRLKTRMNDENKIPIVIVACGSFSPPTYLHLRMFEMAKDTILEDRKYEIMGGYYSPVSDRYKKSGLAPAIHRVRMCELAVEYTSTWLMVDAWEATQDEYQRTAIVLEHFDDEINRDGGVIMSDGSRRRVKILLLAGGDLIESFGHPGVWAEEDLQIILGNFGCIVVERTGSDVWAFLLSHDILYQHRGNIIVVKQLIYNDISSTKVRLFVRRGMSIKYLLPNSVIQYIYSNGLYGHNPEANPP